MTGPQTEGTGCYRCGRTLSANDLGRQETCAGCGFDSRVCKNCRHYDPSSNNECREEQAGRQVEKEKSNFCEWFQPRAGAGGSGTPAKDSLKSAADALFGKKPTTQSPVDNAKAAAEALFKKKS